MATFATRQTEQHYVALPLPCRIANTPFRGGSIPANSSRSFQVTGTTGFSVEGGTSAGCGVPSYAKEVSVAITSTLSVASGNLVAGPTGAAIPKTRTVSLIKGVGNTASADVVIGSLGRITLTNGSTGSTGVLLDVSGYFVDQIEGLIYTGPNPYIYSGTGRILSVSHVATGVVDVTIDRDVSLCTAVVTAFYDKYYYADAKNQGSNMIRIYSWYLSSTTPTTTPIYIDNDVYLSVAC